jgi:hypothetical protein
MMSGVQNEIAVAYQNKSTENVNQNGWLPLALKLVSWTSYCYANLLDGKL